ncbi:MAG: hypothetical protein ACRD1K_12665 [Acidimicrobiales bacterium]
MRNRRAVVVAGVAIGLFLLLVFVDGRRFGNIDNEDTPALVVGARRSLACLGDGVLSRCALVTDDYSDVGPYPLLQYLPAAALVGLGLDDTDAVQALALLNYLALLGCLGCALVLGRRALKGWAPALLVVVLSGPLLFYSTAGFGEMLATSVAVLALTAVLVRRPVAAAALLALACLGKETMAPFLFVMAVVCGRDDGDRWWPRRDMLIAICSAVAGGIAATMAFNVLRFGTVVNAFYIEPGFRVRTLGRQADFFGALWAAPNGGLLWFWTAATGLLVAAAVLAVRRFATAPGNLASWLPLTCVLGVFLAYQVAVARWAYPFGWIAWGPRLTIPVVVPLCIAVAHAGGEPLRAAVARVVRPLPGALAVAFVVAVASLPQSGAVWNYGRATAALLAADGTCPSLPTIPDPGHGRFFACESHVMWRRTPSFLWGPVPSTRAVARVAQVSLMVGLAALVFAGRPVTAGAAPGATVRRCRAVAPR